MLELRRVHRSWGARRIATAESTASEPPPPPTTTPWDELNRARYICWVCTAEPGDELPLRFHPWDTAPAPTATEEGSVTITHPRNPGN